MDEEVNGPGLDELDLARARCDRGGFEGGVNFFDYYDSVRVDDLVEPGDMPRIVSEHQLP
jgi:hypothetical protein